MKRPVRSPPQQGRGAYGGSELPVSEALQGMLWLVRFRAIAEKTPCKDSPLPSPAGGASERAIVMRKAGLHVATTRGHGSAWQLHSLSSNDNGAA
jgi:hypothetical protein